MALYHRVFEYRWSEADMSPRSSTRKTSHSSQSSSSTPSLSSSTSPRSYTTFWSSNHLPLLHSKAMALQHHRTAKSWVSTAKRR